MVYYKCIQPFQFAKHLKTLEMANCLFPLHVFIFHIILTFSPSSPIAPNLTNLLIIGLFTNFTFQPHECNTLDHFELLKNWRHSKIYLANCILPNYGVQINIYVILQTYSTFQIYYISEHARNDELLISFTCFYFSYSFIFFSALSHCH